MYDSPINLIEKQMAFDIDKAIEGEVWKVTKEIGIDVNKEELIKALQYDRDQYEKGYKDATPKWIPVSERLPKYGEKVLCWTTYNAFEVGYRDNEWGQDVWTTGKFASGTFRVVAWMPLPYPYKAESEG